MEGEQQVMLLGDGGRQAQLGLVTPSRASIVVEDRAAVLSGHTSASVYHLEHGTNKPLQSRDTVKKNPIEHKSKHIKQIIQ